MGAGKMRRTESLQENCKMVAKKRHPIIYKGRQEEGTGSLVEGPMWYNGESKCNEKKCESGGSIISSKVPSKTPTTWVKIGTQGGRGIIRECRSAKNGGWPSKIKEESNILVTESREV